MSIIDRFNLRQAPAWKIAVFTLAGLIALALILNILKIGLSAVGFRQIGSVMDNFSAQAPALSYSSSAPKNAEMAALSARNIAGVVPSMDASSGKTAEDFEITEYYATIETRQKKTACATIANLKPLAYVIFETANEYERGCNYYFKVEQKHREEILTVIKDLKPRDLTENTRTIKKQIDDYTSEEEILKKKLATTEETLNNALDDYENLRRLAAQARDVESLAKIIDAKINLIERLSRERINISNQLDRLARAKADELDKLEYTFFRVNIYENKFVDWQNIKDSWKAAVKKFVSDLNRISQGLSIGLITVLLTIIQFVIYLLIAVITVKYVWRLIKRIWQNKPKQ